MAARQKLARDKLVFDEEVTRQLTIDATTRVDGCDERRIALLDCLTRLDPRRRSLIQSKCADGLDLATVADQFGSTVGAIKQKLFRARTALADCVRTRSNAEQIS